MVSTSSDKGIFLLYFVIQFSPFTLSRIYLIFQNEKKTIYGTGSATPNCTDKLKHTSYRHDALLKSMQGSYFESQKKTSELLISPSFSSQKKTRKKKSYTTLNHFSK